MNSIINKNKVQKDRRNTSKKNYITNADRKEIHAQFGCYSKGWNGYVQSHNRDLKEIKHKNKLDEVTEYISKQDYITPEIEKEIYAKFGRWCGLECDIQEHNRKIKEKIEKDKKEKIEACTSYIKNMLYIDDVDTAEIISRFGSYNEISKCVLIHNQMILEEQKKQEILNQQRQENSKKLKAEIDQLDYITIGMKNEMLSQNVDCDTIKEYIENHNNNYKKTEKEKYKDVFIFDGYELNDEQKNAVITDEDSQLVIAGAGCGKTGILVAKVRYLIAKGVEPEKILVLSFTNKTVDEFNQKTKGFTNNKQIAHTFHGLGSSISSSRYNDDISAANIMAGIMKDPDYQKKRSTIIAQIIEFIKQKLSNPIDLQKLILEYISENYKDVSCVSLLEENVQVGLNEFERQRFPSLKERIERCERKGLAIQGEKLKSLAEVKIANFLFLNQIEYQYEKEYTKPFIKPAKGKQYRPDFYIQASDGREIWIEHFGVTKDSLGEYHAKWLKDDDEKRYIQERIDKIRTHQKNQTILIETTQDQFYDNSLTERLTVELAKYGIRLNPRSEEEIAKFLYKIEERERQQLFARYVTRYIGLFKAQSQYKDLDELQDYLVENAGCRYLQDKVCKYFKILKVVYDLYYKLLKANNSSDFNDMINNAIDVINSNDYKKQYDYILVDEYQDITNRRCEFLKALQNKNNAKLLCVGDDWQSIYGFQGSDVSLFTSFCSAGMYKNTPNEPLKIQKTHRNSQELINIAGNFIMKNSNQIKKELHSDKSEKYPIKGVYYHKEKKNIDVIKGCSNLEEALYCTLNNIERHFNNETICVIGRYNIFNYAKQLNLNLDNIGDTESCERNFVELLSKKYSNLNIAFSTIHRAKGMEYDYVIFLDMIQKTEEIHSFPCEIQDDFMMKPLLCKMDTFQNAEERRMFYVVLTRCRKQIYLLVNEENPSCFFDEIKDNVFPLNDTYEQYLSKQNVKYIKCPKCHHGVLLEKDSEKHWYTCSNSSCDFNFNLNGKWILFPLEKCPKCGNAMVIRWKQKDDFPFLGCANYSKTKCNGTKSLSYIYYELLSSLGIFKIDELCERLMKELEM